jgi:photosystem II stability/assembly factor-like uncharacterized protein
MKKIFRLQSCLMLALVFGLSIGVSQAQSGWSTIRLSSGGRDLNAVYFADSKHGWIAGDGGFLAYTDDGGANWIERPLGIDHGVNDLYFVGKDTGFAVAGASIYATTDGGHSWHESYSFLPDTFEGATPELYSLRFNGKKRGWVVGSVSRGDVITNSILAITRDGGTTWQVLQAPTRQELIHIDVVDEKRAWIVGAAGAILHTDDSGESWQKQTSNTTVTLFHVDFRNDKKGWAVGEGGTILRTEDGGKTWTKSDSPTRSTLLSIQFVSDDEGWIVGRGGTILRSNNGGLSWIEQESGTKQNLFALFVSKKSGWAVGRAGLILKYQQ